MFESEKPPGLLHLARPLRIAFLSYRGSPTSGGQGVYTSYLTRELAELGHRVEVFSGPPYPELDPSVVLHKVPSLDLYREPDPFRVPKLSEFKSLEDIAEFAVMCAGGFPEPRSFGWRIEPAITARASEFDIVHDNQSLSWSVLRLWKMGIPTISSIHHPITVDKKVSLVQASSLKERIGLKRFYGFISMQSRVARELPRIITVSKVSRRDISLEMGVELRRISVVPVGVDRSVFHPIAGIERLTDLIVTTASADVALKGLRYLIEAVRLIRSSPNGLNPKLYIIGTERKDSFVQRQVEAQGMRDYVTFLGKVETQQMVELYSQAALAVVPSLYEGFSLPCIEAMAAGTPLVVTDGGALAEVAGSHGRSALVAKAGDAADLAAKIVEVLTDSAMAKKMADRAMLRVGEKFSWRSAALGTLEAYSELLASSRTDLFTSSARDQHETNKAG